MSDETKSTRPSLNAIRDMIKAMNHKHITPKNPIEFQRCIELLMHHPTWKDKLDTIECIKITPSKMNSESIIMKIKPTWCKKYITISWRKCYQVKTRVPKTNSVPNIVPPPITISDPMVDNSMISNDDVHMFQSSDPAYTPNSPVMETKVENPYKKLTGAMRYSIRKQIRDFQKQNRLNRRCRNCSSLLHLQVDHHTIPFVDLQKNFLKQCEEKSLSVPTTFNYSRSTCQPKFKKTDVGFNRRWQNYHKKHADFQWLCKTCNLKKGKK